MLKNIGLMVLGLALVAVLLVSPGISVADDTLTAGIALPADGYTVDVGQAINFSANATGGSAPYAYVWNFGDETQGGGQNFAKSYNAPGQKNVILTVTDFANQHATASITINVQSPVESLSASISAPNDGASFNVGQSIIFSGNATGGSAPYAYVWNFGDDAQGGGQNFDKSYSAAGQKTITLTVTDFANRTATANRTITITAITPHPTPTVDLKVNNSDGPITIETNDAATLTWSTTNATACTASGAWSGSRGTGDSASTGILTIAGTYTYTLTCAGASGSANDSVTVNVSTTPPPPTATVSLKANNTSGSLTLPTGTNLTLSWTTTNATVCTASANPASAAWTGSKETSGSLAISPVPTTPGNYVYTLTCNGVGNSVTVTVPTPNTDPLVITNVRVTDITQTSAIVRWTTNKPANSRVIYDTTSHPNISGASEPNFGYAHSTATQDESTLVTEHAVTLTGLAANTQYYFRVLSR